MSFGQEPTPSSEVTISIETTEPVPFQFEDEDAVSTIARTSPYEAVPNREFYDLSDIEIPLAATIFAGGLLTAAAIARWTRPNR